MYKPTRRELFAMAALQGILANPNIDLNTAHADSIVAQAWELAESMDASDPTLAASTDSVNDENGH